MTIETYTPKETGVVGEKIAAALKAGDILCLKGDLGAGKTVFAQGVAEGLGIAEPVCSPTFTLIQEYYGGRLPLYHFDIYRIDGPWDMEDLGYEDYFYGDGVCLIEWGDLIQGLLPQNTVFVTIEKNPERGFAFRRITIEGLPDETFSD